jgi:hypothetical protein
MGIELSFTSTMPWTIAWFFKIMSFPFELFFWGGGEDGFKPIDFTTKMMPFRFSFDLPLFGLSTKPSTKGHRSNL